MLRVTEYFAKSLKIIRNDTIRQMAYDWRSTVTMALSCIICETKRDIGRKLFFSLDFFIRRRR